MRILLALLIFFFLALPVYAQRGCCSWHGGVDYCDTDVGEYVCNDGTYSPTCTCGYISVDVPPTPTPVPLLGSTDFSMNEDKTIDVYFKWTPVTGSYGYSLGISKYAHADPGPLVDTTGIAWRFKDVKPGNWNINMKVLLSSGYYSPIYSWDVIVPEWYPPTPTPTVTPMVTASNIATDMTGYFYFGGLSTIALAWYLTKNKK